jgi:hypothetical protein
MSTEHPSDQALFDGEPSALAHARACAPCAVRAGRLRAGSALIQRVRRTSQPELDWERVDLAVHQAAEAAAAQVRAARARPARVAPRAALWVGVTLSMAAAATFAVRAATKIHTNSSSDRTLLARPETTVPTVPAVPRVHGGEAPLPPSPAWSEARVLLATDEVTHVQQGGEEAPLRASSRVHAGDRLRARAPSARALVATAVGQRVDLRGPGELRLASLDPAGSQAELVAGEARMDVATSAGKLSLLAQGWRVVLKRGAVIAKIEGDSVRLRALDGIVDVSHGSGAPTVIAPGREVRLDKHGGQSDVEAESRAEPELSRDPLFAGDSDGVLRALPSLEEGVSLSIDGRALPSATRLLRVSRAVRVLARKGPRRWTLSLDPRSEPSAEPVWETDLASLLERTPDAGAPVTASALHVPSATRRPPVTRVALTPATIPAEAQGGYRAVQRALGLRARHCFEACERMQACGDVSGIAPTVELDPQGRVASVRLEGGASPALSACIDREVRALRLPLLAGERVLLGRFAR